MKPLHATLVAAALLLCAKPAFAADSALDVSELTCEQFINYDDNNKGLIMMWFEGYYTEDDEPATIDFGKMAGHLAKLLIACQADPGKKVLDLADDAMSD
ncbi:HdeA/HdeB family chaperone [Methyloceanibacter sp.]|uniref:HdeA/HdeB family chaperone n=1 Tax=Methyloceanibacter sp. TaxID=1965321 RepID=UPI002D34CB8E|nr:HdeA/HdeB family chaperone [Methyloceanibacter sp.]HZP09164.1 HdeA/HdeB family chaperone [Methyloceanibacter sp.]